MRFKVGDRVVPLSDVTIIWRNQPGTVVGTADNGFTVIVRHDFEKDQPPVDWAAEDLEEYDG